MLLLIAVCAVIVMASVIDDHSVALKKQIRLIPQKGFYYIGILQSDSLPEQGKMVAGIKAALASRGYREKDNIRIDVFSADGDEKKLDAQAKNFVKDKKDLIITVGTDATKACVLETKSVPIVGVGMLPPESNNFFDNSYNLTGISDMPAVLNQIRMAAKVLSLQTVGIIFNPKDEGAVIQLNLLRDASEKKGIHIYEVAFDEKEDPISQIEKFSGHVDAVYIPADETVLKSFDEIVKHLMKLGIPVIGENAEMVRRGALPSVSAEYYRMGFSGGRIASELLDGKKKPYEIGITKQIDPDWIVNMSVAKTLKKELPYDVWQKARKLYLYDGQAARP